MAAALQKQLDNKDYVKGALENWAAWFRAVRLPGLDYPAKANFVFTVTGDQEFDSLVAEQVDRHLCRLKMIFPEQFEALYFEYAMGYSNFEAAQAMRVSLATYKNYLCRGFSFMAGALGGA